MKKAILILMLALVASFASAQQRTIIEYNGYDWTTWSNDQKIAIVTGYILGLDTYRSAMKAAYARSKDQTVKSTLESMYNWGYIEANVGQICGTIEKIYNTRTNDGKYGNREYPLYELIVHEYQVPWWIDSQGNDLNMDGTRKDGSSGNSGS
jgi:hypothetical protein